MFVAAGVVVATTPACTHDGDRVGDVNYLFELVTDKDDCAPFGLQLAHKREQILDLRGGEHGSRLVQNQNVGASKA